MLTCQVGESIINCIDGTYDRYRLKKWSSKGILKCPVCNGQYEYCHGEIMSPYFRHLGKECKDHFSETETDEHRKGKELLYNWIKDQAGVKNCKLESWIPETKQRPDIYFEKEGKRFVIEFQCTPIASEYLLRKELYRLAGINDIWVLGMEKYRLETDGYNNFFHEANMRTIEKETDKDNLFYLDVEREIIVSNYNYLKRNYGLFNIIEKEGYPTSFLQDKYKTLFSCLSWLSSYKDYYFSEKLSEFKFGHETFSLNKYIIDLFTAVEQSMSLEWAKELELRKEKEKLKNKREEIKEERKAILENIKKNTYVLSDHVGKTGETVRRLALVTKKRLIRSRYGLCYICELLDCNNNVFVLFADTLMGIEELNYVEFAAVIKEHNIYDGIRQTYIEDFKQILTNGGI